MTTFGLTATYVFIICWITGSSIMAAGGWTAIPMWVLGILTFLVPAGMAVAELGNLWPGEGGVYIWATRTMGETWGFIGGYLSWIPVVLNSASSPAIILQFLLLAFHAELGLTLTIILQLVLLWAVIGLALAKLAANQRIMNVVFVVYWALTAVIFISGVVYALSHGSAQPFSAHAALVPDFAGAGFLYGTVLLYLVGVETPYNMGAEFLSVRRSGPKMVVWGSIALVIIYLLTTLGTMMVLPADEIDPVTGVIGMLGTAAPKGVMEVCAIVLACIVFVALMSYQVTYSRLIFVSGLERHLPRIFTHLNPRTRNPVTAVLIQGVLSSLILVGLYSQSSMANVTVFLQGGLSIAWLHLRVLLPDPGHHRPQEVRRPVCQREVLAYSRRHGRRVDRRPRRHTGHHGRHLLLVREVVDQRRTGRHMDGVDRQHRGGHVPARRGRLHLRPPGRAQDLRGRRTGASRSTRVEGRGSQMTMESTVPSTDAVDNASRYPLDPLTGAEIETAATVISDSEYATPTLKFVMIQLAEPDKTAELTFEGDR